MSQLISFCINTAQNELNHVQLLFKSLEQNLSILEHEIIVFVDSDNQGTTEWLLTQKQIFPNLKVLKNELPICYGYARNINEMFKFASNEIISYLQSDMVVCKNYDIDSFCGSHRRCAVREKIQGMVVRGLGWRNPNGRLEWCCGWCCRLGCAFSYWRRHSNFNEIRSSHEH